MFDRLGRVVCIRCASRMNRDELGCESVTFRCTGCFHQVTFPLRMRRAETVRTRVLA